jgi:hypothetical protein
VQEVIFKKENIKIRIQILGAGPSCLVISQKIWNNLKLI